MSKDPFKTAGANYKKEQEEKENYEGSNWVEPDMSALSYSALKLFRVLSGMPDAEGRSPFDAKSVHVGFIKDDKEKNMMMKIDAVDEDHIILKIVAKVMESTWVNDEKVYVNKTKHPELFEMVAKNNFPKTDADKYRMEKGWKGSQIMFINAIDREMEAQHKETGKSIIIAKGSYVAKSGKDEGKTKFNAGVSAHVMRSEIAEVFEFYGDWRTYDIGVQRNKDWQNSMSVFCASEEDKKVTAPKLKALLAPVRPLEEWEAGLEKWNLDEIYKPTSYGSMLKRLTKKINLIDATLGTSFLNELTVLAEAEKEALDLAKAEAGETEAPKTEETKTEETKATEATVEPTVEAEVKTATVQREAVQREAVTPTATDLGDKPQWYKDAVEGGFKHIENIEKYGVTPLSFDKEACTLVFDEAVNGTTYRCVNGDGCTSGIPAKVLHCPKCNQEQPPE